jgi:hypothetical protein
MIDINSHLMRHVKKRKAKKGRLYFILKDTLPLFHSFAFLFWKNEKRSLACAPAY